MIAKTIRTCFPIAAAAVSEKAEEINKLNVFPVPDGDTGTNMSLTLASVTKELSALPADADMEAIAGAITHGSLMAPAATPVSSPRRFCVVWPRALSLPMSPLRPPISPSPSVVLSRSLSRLFVSPSRARFSRSCVMFRPRQTSARRRSSLPRMRSTPSSSRPTSPSPARPTCCPSSRRTAWSTPAPLALPSSWRTLLPPLLAAAPWSRISPPRLIPLVLHATRLSIASKSRPTTTGRARSSATATSSSLRPTLPLTRTSA